MEIEERHLSSSFPTILGTARFVGPSLGFRSVERPSFSDLLHFDTSFPFQSCCRYSERSLQSFSKKLGVTLPTAFTTMPGNTLSRCTLIVHVYAGCTHRVMTYICIYKVFGI